MEESIKYAKCSQCHIDVRGSDYFCFNCGYNLKPKPPSTDFVSVMVLLLKSFILPPLGIYWGYSYIKQGDAKSKAVGFLAIAITVVMLILAFVWTKQFADTLNAQLGEQMNTLSF